jgi:hypothetical protein
LQIHILPPNPSTKSIYSSTNTDSQGLSTVCRQEAREEARSKQAKRQERKREANSQEAREKARSKQAKRQERKARQERVNRGK